MRSFFRWTAFHIPAAVAVAFLCAQESQPVPPKRPEQSIRDLIDDFGRAANSRDAVRLSQLFMSSGEVIVQNQLIAAGPDQVRKSLAPPPTPWSERTTARFQIDRIQRLSNTAIVYVTRSYYTSTSPHSTICTFVLEKTVSGWLIASFRQMQLSGFPLNDPLFEMPDLH